MRATSTPIARSRARSTPAMFLMSSFPAGIPAAVTAGSSGRLALTWASSSAYPALKRVVSGESVSWAAIVLTSENRLDLRKKATNFSDWAATRLNRMNFAKMITHETSEKKSRIPRTTFAVGPVSRKKTRRESPPAGRFSARTGCRSASNIVSTVTYGQEGGKGNAGGKRSRCPYRELPRAQRAVSRSCFRFLGLLHVPRLVRPRGSQNGADARAGRSPGNPFTRPALRGNEGLGRFGFRRRQGNPALPGRDPGGAETVRASAGSHSGAGVGCRAR